MIVSWAKYKKRLKTKHWSIYNLFISGLGVFSVVLLKSWGIMPLCWIFVPSMEYNFLLCYELQEGCRKFKVRSPWPVQGKWW
jgi:hypothetical protein